MKDCSECVNCMYIGEGDSMCEQYQTLVLVDWCPTEDYGKCNNKPKKKKVRK